MQSSLTWFENIMQLIKGCLNIKDCLNWIISFVSDVSNTFFASGGTIAKYLLALFILISLLLVISYAVMHATRIMLDVTKKLFVLVGVIMMIAFALWLVLWLTKTHPCNWFEKQFNKVCQTSTAPETRKIVHDKKPVDAKMSSPNQQKSKKNGSSKKMSPRKSTSSKNNKLPKC